MNQPYREDVHAESDVPDAGNKSIEAVACKGILWKIHVACRDVQLASLRLEVRAWAGVSVWAWYIALSLPMNTPLWKTLTISSETYREMGIK